MLYREIIAVCSQIDTKHINTVRGQNVEFSVLQQITTLHAYVSETFGPCKQNPNIFLISQAVLHLPYLSKHIYTHTHTLTFIYFLYPNPN